jgi:hypothetical protein
MRVHRLLYSLSRRRLRISPRPQAKGAPRLRAVIIIQLTESICASSKLTTDPGPGCESSNTVRGRFESRFQVLVGTEAAAVAVVAVAAPVPLPAQAAAARAVIVAAAVAMILPLSLRRVLRDMIIINTTTTPGIRVQNHQNPNHLIQLCRERECARGLSRLFLSGEGSLIVRLVRRLRCIDL